MRIVVSTIIGLMLVLAVAPAVGAQTNLTDVALCNEVAHRRVGAPSASPSTREKPPSLMPERGTRTDPSGSIVAEAPDPLLEGMAADGLRDPAYRGAYRECMAARKARTR